MPESPNTTTEGGSGTTTPYRFYNVQKEERRSKEPTAAQTAGKAINTATKTTGTALQASGAAVQVAGVGIQVAGSAVKGVGTGISAIGMGLSATGVGSVVGAPITAVGRVVGLGGSAVKLGGKVTSMTGKGMRKTGGMIKKVGEKARQASKAMVSVAKYTPHGRVIRWIIFSWFFMLYGLQLIFVLLSLGFLALAAGLSLTGNWFEIIGTILDWVIDAIQWFTGLNLNLAEHMGSIFGFFHILAFHIGVMSLLLATLICVLTLRSPFWGDMAPVKIGIFIAAFVGLAIPVANLVPWAVVYMWAIDQLDA